VPQWRCDSVAFAVATVVMSTYAVTSQKHIQFQSLESTRFCISPDARAPQRTRCAVRAVWAVLSPPSLWPRRPHRRPAPAQTPEQSANVQQSASVFVNLYPLTWQDGVDCWQAFHGRSGWDCTLQICVLSLPNLVPTRFETVQVTDLKSVGGCWG